ncbi:MAG: hypothetical protein QXN26_03810 [Thermoplasmataceae archaeon]
MLVEPAILLAAMGITLLEMSEASAVALALHGDSRSNIPFYAVAFGVIVIILPAALVGNFIALFPLFYVRIASATLLLYFGQRLMKSAKRSMKFQRIGFPPGKHAETGRSVVSTAFSVGVVEAFEAAIVLVALFPENYDSTLIGLVSGIVVVIVAAYILRGQIRKIKQADMKVAVSALLLSFSLFWYIESVRAISDLFLLPFFAGFCLLVYIYSARNLPPASSARTL